MNRNTIYEKLIHGQLGQIEDFYISDDFYNYFEEYEIAEKKLECCLNQEQLKAYEKASEAIRRMHIEEMRCAYGKGFCEGLELGMIFVREESAKEKSAVKQYLNELIKKFN